MMLVFLGCDGASVVGFAGDASTRDLGTGEASTDAVACGAGQTACLGACVSTATSTEHCGACSRSCRTGEACQNGACIPACGSAETLGGGGDAGLTCANLMTDLRNCGLCGRGCERDRVCSSGVCTFMCRAGLREQLRVVCRRAALWQRDATSDFSAGAAHHGDRRRPTQRVG